MNTLTVPVGPQDHAQGPKDAPVTLVEYGDYQCPHCARAYPIVKAVQKRMGKKLLFVFRNMPLSQIHPSAELAAETAEAAAEQGKFWEMHDALFENQDQLGPELVVALSERLGLDPRRLEADLRNGKFREHVKKDFNGGVRSGVAGTPTFFINGERFDGDWTSEEALLEALRSPGQERYRET